MNATLHMPVIMLRAATVAVCLKERFGADDIVGNHTWNVSMSTGLLLSRSFDEMVSTSTWKNSAMVVLNDSAALPFAIKG